MILYGTVTSPYVRRVRIVASVLGIELQLHDTATKEGQAKLRRVTPIWKVPALQDDNTIVFDSHQIIDYLRKRNSNDPFALTEAEQLEKANLINVIDGALDSAINVFYLRKDNPDLPSIPYLSKQEARITNAMAWLEDRAGQHAFQSPPSFGLKEIALISTLDWMVFRKAYEIEKHKTLCTLRDDYATESVFSQTAPG